MAVGDGDARRAYRTLELSFGAPFEEVKQAYRDLMNIWHPDRFAHDVRLRKRCEEKVKALGEAYRVIEEWSRADPAGGQKAAPRKERSGAAGPPAGPPVSPGRWRTLTPAIQLGKWGYADASGAMAIAARFDTAGPFSEGLAAVSTGGEYGYIDASGRFVIEPRFLGAEAFSEGLALVYAGRYGYVDRKGEYAIRPRFDAGQAFREGVAGVKLNGKWGYVDAHGTWMAAPEYDEAQAFENGRGYVRKGRQRGYVLRGGTFKPLE